MQQFEKWIQVQNSNAKIKLPACANIYKQRLSDKTSPSWPGCPVFLLTVKVPSRRGLHAVDPVVVDELFEVMEVVPPLEEEGFCDQAEPGRDLQLFPPGFLQDLLQLLFGHVAVALDLVGVWIQIHVFLHEEDVVDLVLAPDAV